MLHDLIAAASAALHAAMHEYRRRRSMRNRVQQAQLPF